MTAINSKFVITNLSSLITNFVQLILLLSDRRQREQGYEGMECES